LMMNIEKLLGSPRSTLVEKVIQENRRDRTILFSRDVFSREPKPGQFAMVWIPGVDEIPMSVSYCGEDLAGLTVRPVGPATEALAALKRGDLIGIRGPFGNGFVATAQVPLIVGGGIGMAPLRLLVHEFANMGVESDVVIAARKSDELLFAEELQSLARSGVRVHVATDDGSMGVKGLAIDVVQELLTTHHFDMIYTCGPEKMMVSLWQLAMNKGIDIAASLERYMKCGCGLCGSCALDPTGDLVCIQGPVFTGEQLSRIKEFGVYSRDSTGVRIPL